VLVDLQCGQVFCFAGEKVLNIRGDDILSRDRTEGVSMTTERRDDLKSFHEFVGEQLANGGSSLTPTEALDLWELQNPSEDEEQETVEAIRRGLADVEAGRVMPAREALAELRRKHNLRELS